MMNRESSLFKEISKEMIVEILKEHFQTDLLVSYNLKSGGLFNTTYQIILGEHHKKVILRLGPVNQHLLLNFEKHLMEPEQEVYRLLRSAGIPCPCIIAMDTSRRLFDRDYMITEFADGQPMSEADISKEDKERLYVCIGEYIKTMHSITAPSFGFVYDCMNGRGYASWYQFILSFVTNILESSKKFQAFTEEETCKIYETVRSREKLLDGIKNPRLLHCDIWEGNILTVKRNAHHELSLIMDGDRAVYGDPDYELASGWMINRDFLRGYGIKPSEYNDAERVERRKIYALLFCLIDTYVGIAEYNQKEQYLNGHRKIREMIDFDFS